jgi:AraC family transcriptional activator of tynA and feaB
MSNAIGGNEVASTPGRSGEAAPGALSEWKTDGVPAGERLALWREGVLRRMTPVRFLTPDRPFRGKLTRVTGQGVEFAVHASDALLAVRDQARCSADGCDDVAVAVMLAGESARTRNGVERGIGPGAIYVVDYSQPVEMVRSCHRDASLMMSRHRVSEVLGRDPRTLAGKPLQRRGMAALLGAHVHHLVGELPELTCEHRAIAVTTAMEMALAALQQAQDDEVDADRFPLGLYQAARAVIARRCADPHLTPDMVARTIGCSRATLYRLFSGRDRSVAATIWTARLVHAAELLSRADLRDLEIGEIAFRSGFLDHATFSRMFRRHFGLSPRDARARAGHGRDGTGRSSGSQIAS